MALFMAQGYHQGERQMHQLMKAPEFDNPTSYGLTHQAAHALQAFPLLAVGTLDDQSRPWTSIWGGEPGLSAPLGGGMIGIRTAVDMKWDPVVQSLLNGKQANGELVKAEGKGRSMAGLAINLMTRKRVKLAGRFVAGAVTPVDSDDERPGSIGEGEAQAVVRIEESLGNCPKYLHKREIRPAPLDPKPQSASPQFSQEAVQLVRKADFFFVSTSYKSKTMDTNNRGGPAGFVRVISNGEDGAEIIWPEYSGNRLYQSLGNLAVTPLAGLAFPNFDTGDVLYLTGTTEILIGADAAALLPRSNLAVKVKVTDARFVFKGLPFRGTKPSDSSQGMSPYTPPVRLLASEGNIAAQLSSPTNTARLVQKEELTRTIHRYTFELHKKQPYRPGQWVALDFSEELDIGYSHMRDDDPSSLNDDFVRTFTVSNPPAGPQDTPQATFQLTVRRNGPVTGFLCKRSTRPGLEVPLKAFGGDFRIETPGEGGVVPFIAGGVGITPLLGQLPQLDLGKLRFLWVIQVADQDFVLDVLRVHSGLAKATTIFFTSIEQSGLSKEQEGKLTEVRGLGAKVLLRRPEQSDLEAGSAVLDAQMVEKWYICAGRSLRNYLLKWLSGKTVIYENFDY